MATLSGGEANRLLLAKALINPGNYFILDEPTCIFAEFSRMLISRNWFSWVKDKVVISCFNKGIMFAEFLVINAPN